MKHTKKKTNLKKMKEKTKKPTQKDLGDESSVTESSEEETDSDD